LHVVPFLIEHHFNPPIYFQSPICPEAINLFPLEFLSLSVARVDQNVEPLFTANVSAKAVARILSQSLSEKTKLYLKTETTNLNYSRH
jgi:hypothetical protein